MMDKLKAKIKVEWKAVMTVSTLDEKMDSLAVEALVLEKVEWNSVKLVAKSDLKLVARMAEGRIIQKDSEMVGSKV